MERKMLKTSLLGFSKSSVCEYIADVNEDFNRQIKDLNREHKKETERLNEKIARLEQELRDYNTRNVDISKAILDAQSYANTQKDQADEQYQAAMERIQAQIGAENGRLEQYQGFIRQMHENLVAFLEETDRRLLEFEEESETIHYPAAEHEEAEK